MTWVVVRVPDTVLMDFIVGQFEDIVEGSHTKEVVDQILTSMAALHQVLVVDIMPVVLVNIIPEAADIVVHFADLIPMVVNNTHNSYYFIVGQPANLFR